jgi:molybdenum cofactor biosynthesis enzyme MoaA
MTLPMKIIKVTPIEKYFSLTWRITRRCNYDCHYCDRDWHDTVSPLHDQQKLQEAWINIYERTRHRGLPYKISFTGGEVTINRAFLPFVSWLRQNYGNDIFQLLVTSNGSASYNYYLKMFESIDNITFSVHSEHINEQKFFDKIISLKESMPARKFLHVAIMDEPWNQDRIPYYIELLDSHQISHSVRPIDFSHQTRDTPHLQGEMNFAIQKSSIL